MEDKNAAFWSIERSKLLDALDSRQEGLTEKEATQRLKEYGANTIKPHKKRNTLLLLISQFKSPIILLLLIAATISLSFRAPTDAVIIFTIVITSGILGFWQEKGANEAVEKLISIVKIKTKVLRDNTKKEILTEDIVPGDIIFLSAGGAIPADCIILESKNLFADESTLTGESYPAKKKEGLVDKNAKLAHRTNTLFMGTHIVSGDATALIVTTGKTTEFGKISEHLKTTHPETEFEQGIKHFGYFLMQVTIMLTFIIFAINAYLERPILDSFLFAVALAVGLTPQLLPAIISVNLSHGAKIMSKKSVIVKRLSSIENFGSMNILCCDKTGTLTEGVASIQSIQDLDGKESQKVLLQAYLNAFYQAGFNNPIDDAIRKHKSFDTTEYKKLDEIPYDFVRKRLSILVSRKDKKMMITKGTFHKMTNICSKAEINDKIVDIKKVSKKIQQQFEELSKKGNRIITIAYKNVKYSKITNKDETEMTLTGFIVLHDKPKEGIIHTIKHLESQGITLKIISGDNARAAALLAQQIGINHPLILLGQEINRMNENTLIKHVESANIFAEVEPTQKERIIQALKKSGKVVGFLGDGINDAPALYTADIGISVNSAADVAREAADIVLLKKDLEVLVEGVKEGRRTFANTLKYVFMATSANFGNMFSMAGASLFLNFLPLLPKQILLTNLLTDFPEMTIATDSVDTETLEKPRRWNTTFIRKFMLTFGILSSIFDYLTFGSLMYFVNATNTQFRTGWFTESVISAAVIVLVIRTKKTIFKSTPNKYLMIATFCVVAATIMIPYTPIATIFGFEPLPTEVMYLITAIMVAYIISAEITKKIFYKYVEF